MTNPLNSPTGFYGLTTKPLNTSVITADPVYNAINGTFQTEVGNGAPSALAIQGILAADAQYTADRETAITKETKVR